MIKAVVVRENIVKKIIVTKDIANVKLFTGDELKDYPKNRKLSVGGKYDSAWTLFLKKVGIK